MGLLVAAAVGAVIGGAINLGMQIANGNADCINWNHVLGSAIVGGFIGAGIGLAYGLGGIGAALGAGMIFQSDHSVPSYVSAENYEYVVNLVREYGQYPLQLGEHDIADL